MAPAARDPEASPLAAGAPAGPSPSSPSRTDSRMGFEFSALLQTEMSDDEVRELINQVYAAFHSVTSTQIHSLAVYRQLRQGGGPLETALVSH